MSAIPSPPLPQQTPIRVHASGSQLKGKASLAARAAARAAARSSPPVIGRLTYQPRTTSSIQAEATSPGGTAPLSHLIPPQRRFIRLIEHAFNRELFCLPRADSMLEILGKVDLATPKPYIGGCSEPEFQVWVLDMIVWLSLKGFQGMSESMDRCRVLVIGKYLEGEAKEWYSSVVASPMGRLYGISSLSVLCELYLRFIPQSAHIEARDQFEAATYQYQSQRSGAADLLAKLQRLSPRMYKPSSEREIQQRFISALPQNLIDIMEREDNSRVVDWERSNDELLQAAQRAECTLLEETRAIPQPTGGKEKPVRSTNRGADKAGDGLPDYTTEAQTPAPFSMSLGQ